TQRGESQKGSDHRALISMSGGPEGDLLGSSPQQARKGDLTMKVKTPIKAGKLVANHNEAQVRDPAKADLNRRSSFTLLILLALAVCAGFAFGPASLADDRTKAELDKMKEAIKRNGKLPAGAKGASYWRHAEVLHQGQRRTVAATLLHKTKAGTSSALTPGTGSTLSVVRAEGVTVGDAPPGFGKGFTWDRADNEILLVMFINAADPLGISIDGVQAGDQVQVLSASGIASFSEDKGNPLASSIIGLVAKGGNIALGAAGAPEVKPLIDAAEQFAKDQFKATNAKTKRRDAFGVDPGSGHKAREEGGLLVCLPEAGGIFYSGDGDHKGRWIKPNGVRTDDHWPAPSFGIFFHIKGNLGHNTRTLQQSGQMYITAWDWKFEDNAGFYKVFVKLTKGNGLPPPVILRKESTAKPKSKP